MEYIEREALMDRIELNAREYGEEYDAWQILGDVEDFPSADVAPVVHGRLINERMLVGGMDEKWAYDCSCCGETIEDPTHKPNYCPNCGAKMDGERREE